MQPIEQSIKASVERFWRNDPCSPDFYNAKELQRCITACTMLWQHKRGGLVPHFLFCIPLSLPYILDSVGPVPDIRYPKKKLTEWALLGTAEKQRMMVNLAGAISALWWYSGWMPIDSREMTQHMAALYRYYPALFHKLADDPQITCLSDVPEDNPTGCDPPLPPRALSALLESLAQDGELWAMTRRTFAGASSLASIDGLAQLEYLPEKRLPELETVADRYLGFKEYEIPNFVGALAMNSGKIYENLTRLAGQHVIQLDLGEPAEIREMGMTPAPYLPVVYAQSADGVIADLVVEIKTKWTGYTYDTLPDHYASQVIQAALCSNKTRVIFIAGQRRTDMTKSMQNWKPVDNSVMELTVEMLDFSPELLDRSRKLFVTFAAFMYQYAREHLLRAIQATQGKAEYPDIEDRIKSAYKARQILKQHIERDRIDIQALIGGEGITRTYYRLPWQNPETGQTEFLKVRRLKVSVKDFICQGDEALYEHWMNVRNPDNLATIAWERQKAYDAAKSCLDEDGFPAPKFVPIQRLPPLHIVRSTVPPPLPSNRGMSGALEGKPVKAPRAVPGAAKKAAAPRKRKRDEEEKGAQPKAKRQKRLLE